MSRRGHRARADSQYLEANREAIRKLGRDPGDARATVVRLSDVRPLPVDWLWKDRIPLGAVTILDGLPGLGKSVLTLDLAARISTGLAMPDGSPGIGPAGVVILTSEDDIARTIVPRLDAAGADRSLVVTVPFHDDDGHEREPELVPEDLERIAAAIRECRALLVVIDPLVAFMPGTVDTAVDADVRKVMRRLRALAEREGCAVCTIRHPRKAPTASAVNRGGGSVGLIAAARSGLLLAPDPDKEGGLVLASSKSNLGPRGPSLRLRLVDRSGYPVVEWGRSCSHTADGLLAAADAAAERHARKESEAREAAARAETHELATAALRERVESWAAAGTPMRKNEDAVSFLVDRGVSRDPARKLVRDRNGTDWRIAGGGKRGEPEVLLPVCGDSPQESPQESESVQNGQDSTNPAPSTLADRMNAGPQEMAGDPGAIDAGSAPRISCGRMDRGPQETGSTEAAPDAASVEGRRFLRLPPTHGDATTPRHSLGLAPGIAEALDRHGWELVEMPEGWEPGPGENRAPRPATAAAEPRTPAPPPPSLFGEGRP